MGPQLDTCIMSFQEPVRCVHMQGAKMLACLQSIETHNCPEVMQHRLCADRKHITALLWDVQTKSSSEILQWCASPWMWPPSKRKCRRSHMSWHTSQAYKARGMLYTQALHMILAQKDLDADLSRHISVTVFSFTNSWRKMLPKQYTSAAMLFEEPAKTCIKRQYFTVSREMSVTSNSVMEFGCMPVL